MAVHTNMAPAIIYTPRSDSPRFAYVQFLFFFLSLFLIKISHRFSDTLYLLRFTKSLISALLPFAFSKRQDTKVAQDFHPRLPLRPPALRNEIISQRISLLHEQLCYDSLQLPENQRTLSPALRRARHAVKRGAPMQKIGRSLNKESQSVDGGVITGTRKRVHGRNALFHVARPNRYPSG